MFEDVKNVAKSEATEKTEDSTTKSIKKVKESVEKSTLGDFGVLSALRSELETSEKKTKDAPADDQVEKKPKKTKAAKDDETSADEAAN
jgi:small subunit ribosomal protein S1